MVKGMTRRIVEIRDTGSCYFERAIFFVRMDVAQGVTEYTLAQEASKIIDRLCSDLRLNPTSGKSRLIRSLKASGIAAAGAAAAILIMKLFAL